MVFSFGIARVPTFLTYDGLLTYDHHQLAFNSKDYICFKLIDYFAMILFDPAVPMRGPARHLEILQHRAFL
jgi:hypothetical protein